jgi:hypothetical protein
MGEQGLESHPNDSNLAQNPGENWAIKESLVIAFYYAILTKNSHMIDEIIRYAYFKINIPEDAIIEIYQIAFDNTTTFNR